MIVSKVDAPVVRTFSEYLPEPYVDEVGDAKYYGWAPMGVSEEDDEWRIMKETKSGTVIKREYAQGTMEFVSAWSKRTTYKYSR